MNNLERALKRLDVIIAGSNVPEDRRHAKNTLVWLLRLHPRASHALQIAAFTHDIERAFECKKVHHVDFDDYDTFKAAHATNSANILPEILTECGIDPATSAEVCRLVALHETGGDAGSDLLRNADGISYFAVNLPLYYQREGWRETKRRSVWGYQRLSTRAKEIVKNLKYSDEALKRLLREVTGG